MAVRQLLSAFNVVLLCAIVSAGRIVMPGEEVFNHRDFTTRNFRSPYRNNVIRFNNDNRPRFQPQPVFRPMHSNPNSFSPVRYPIKRFEVPQISGSPHGPQNIGPQAGISFTNNRVSFQSPGTPHSNSNDHSIDHREKNPTISFSNKPSVPIRNPTRITNEDRNAPISFGGGGSRMSFPGVTSISNKPRVQSTVVFATNPTPTFNSGFPTTVVDYETTFGTDTTLETINGSNEESSAEPSGSPAIFFPGSTNIPGFEITDDDQNYTNNNLPDDSKCELTEREVYFNGNCSILLHQWPCEDDHWLVLSDDGTPYCSNRQCPWDKLYYKGKCVYPGDDTVCKPGEILYVSLTGSVDCDCEPEYIYDPASRNCYAEHEQGFCLPGYYLQHNEDGQITCVVNPCLNDGFVDHEGQCYKKNYHGSCTPSLVMILDDGTADCLFIVAHSIFDIPTLQACPPGSKRDFFEKCRAVFRIPSQATQRSLRGRCTQGFVLDRRGTCRRVVSLFG